MAIDHPPQASQPECAACRVARPFHPVKTLLMGSRSPRRIGVDGAVHHARRARRRVTRGFASGLPPLWYGGCASAAWDSPLGSRGPVFHDPGPKPTICVGFGPGSWKRPAFMINRRVDDLRAYGGWMAQSTTWPTPGENGESRITGDGRPGGGRPRTNATWDRQSPGGDRALSRSRG